MRFLSSCRVEVYGLCNTQTTHACVHCTTLRARVKHKAESEAALSRSPSCPRRSLRLNVLWQVLSSSSETPKHRRSPWVTSRHFVNTADSVVQFDESIDFGETIWSLTFWSRSFRRRWHLPTPHWNLILSQGSEGSDVKLEFHLWQGKHITEYLASS